MIAGWFLYCAATAVLLCVAAAAAEAALEAVGRASRWVWVIAIVASLLFPPVAYLVQRRSSTNRALQSAVVNARGITLAERTPFLLERKTAPPPPPTERWPRVRVPEIQRLNGFLIDAAIACILFAALRIATDSVSLYRRRRRWTPEVVDGAAVLVSDDFGPAIVGLITPVVVLPRWTLALSRDERELMFAHEQEHLRASDGRLTTVGLLAVLCMPWNPAIWWQWRRLRIAIEVDCDRRVLRAFPDVSRYGRLLVDVARRAVGGSFAVAGFSERAFPLAHRIRAITPSRSPARAMLVVANVTIVVAGLTSALALAPPAAALRSLVHRANGLATMPQYAADSIAVGETPHVVRAAHDLPGQFEVAPGYGSSVAPRPQPGRCAERLRDPRDGTALVNRVSMTALIDVDQRADTTWAHLAHVAYYSVTPAGRYGVTGDELLRVSCGSQVSVAAGDGPAERPGVVSLRTPGDDRARRLGAWIHANLALDADAIELKGRRIDVAISNPVLTAKAPTAWRARAREINAAVRQLYGAAAPDTLVVTLQVADDHNVALVEYIRPPR